MACVLCTGDLHIGRRASKAPWDDGGTGFSCSDIWQDIVAAAISRQVDLVAISGDIIDRDNRFLESVGAFERGLKRLAHAGIPTVAVGGNHDWESLPLLAESLAGTGFQLVGQRGAWERAAIVVNGVPALWIEGWSFPSLHVETSPLAGHEIVAPTDGLPLIGMLHADLDQLASPHGPVSFAELQRAPVSFWLLGHVHAPLLRQDGGVPVLYPGSPLAMDFGELGLHGVWIVDLGPGTAPSFTRVALSPIRYLIIDVDVSEVRSQLDMQSQLLHAIRQRIRTETHGADGDALRFAACRIRLTGYTEHYGSLDGWCQVDASDLSNQIDQVAYAVDSITNAARPALDLRSMAQFNNPPGILARLLLAIEDGEIADEAAMSLLARATQATRRTHGAAPYGAVDRDPYPDPATVTGLVHQEGYRLLETLVRQKDAPAI